MSKVIHIHTEKELEAVIKSYDSVVVDFHAEAWCRPCVQFAPHFEEASDRSDAVFVAVDIDKAPWASEVYGIMSVPTVKLYKGGEFNKNVQARTILPLLSEIS